MAIREDRATIADERRKRLGQIEAAAAAAIGPGGARPPGGEDARFRGRARLADACEIQLDRICPDPDQPRTEFDPGALDQLADSLKARGVLQPIRVRWDAAVDRYVVIVGERRWRAARRAGLRAIPCVVADAAATPEELLEDQVVENCLRVDLNPMEQAEAFRTLMARQGLTQTQLAAKLHISQPTVMKTLALLTLPEPIKGQVRAGELGAYQAYVASRIADPAEQAAAVGRAIERAARPARARKARPWSFEVAGVARVRVEPLGDDPDPHALADALRAAERAYRKAIPKPDCKSDAA